MSYIDYEIDQFFNRLARVALELKSNKNWIDLYVKNREKYPKWITKDKKQIKVKDLEDSHIENIIKLIKNKRSYWYKVLQCERTYRYLLDKQKELQKEYSEMISIKDTCL